MFFIVLMRIALFATYKPFKAFFNSNDKFIAQIQISTQTEREVP